MTPEQSAAYVMAQAACVNAAVASMQAANWIAISQGLAPEFGPAAFESLIENYGIHHNSLLSLFHR